MPWPSVWDDLPNATVSQSRSEGVYSTASGVGSHVEGFSAKALGSFSHAEGEETVALGRSSHTEGQGTISSGSYQHTQGKYNTQGNTTSLMIIGNGTNDTTRSDLALFNTNGIVFNQPLTASVVSGSFEGDGSGLTGVTGEWDGSHSGSASITGSLTLSGSYPGTALTVETYKGKLEFESGASRTNENIKLLLTGEGSGATDVSLYKNDGINEGALSIVTGFSSVGFFYELLGSTPSTGSFDFVPYSNPQTATSYGYAGTVLPLSIVNQNGYVAIDKSYWTKTCYYR